MGFVDPSLLIACCFLLNNAKKESARLAYGICRLTPTYCVWFSVKKWKVEFNETYIRRTILVSCPGKTKKQIKNFRDAALPCFCFLQSPEIQKKKTKNMHTVEIRDWWGENVVELQLVSCSSCVVHIMFLILFFVISLIGVCVFLVGMF